MTEDTSSWQSAASAAEECQYLNRMYYKEDWKVIFLTEWGKKMDGNLCHWGGGGVRRNGKCHFKVPVFLEYSLKLPYHRQCSKCLFTWFNFAHNCTKHQLVLQSTSSCFKAPARALIIWKGFIDWNRPDYLANSLDGFPQKMPSLRLPASR